MEQQHPNIRAVQEALDAAGVRTARGEPSRVTILDDGVHTAAAAAAALGVEVGQIANSLVFEADGEPLLVMTSGAHRVDVPHLAAELGVTRLGRATPEFVRLHTGQAIGGVAPVHPGRPGQMRTVIDTMLFGYEEIWTAAGVPESVVAMTPADLQRLTGGTALDVA
jgi:prolyl-tRNA editing enzyme YbaK/EbsC (Cys-tRNA(Pro) deacylase)